jgi:hypothetical protein
MVFDVNDWYRKRLGQLFGYVKWLMAFAGVGST